MQSDKEFKMTVLKKYNELQENSENQYNDFRNKITNRRNILPKRLKF